MQDLKRYLAAFLVFSSLCCACAPVPSKKVSDSNSAKDKTSNGKDVFEVNFEGDILSVEKALEPEHQDKEILLTGIVIHQYICPPCPPMAHCEMCLDQHVVLSDKFEEVNGYAHAAGRKDWLFLQAFSRMEKGARYIVRVRMEGRRGDPSTSGWIVGVKKMD